MLTQNCLCLYPLYDPTSLILLVNCFCSSSGTCVNGTSAMSIMRSFCRSSSRPRVSLYLPDLCGQLEKRGLPHTWAWLRPWLTTYRKPYVRIASRTMGASSASPSGVFAFERSMVGKSAQSTAGTVHR